MFRVTRFGLCLTVAAAIVAATLGTAAFSAEPAAPAATPAAAPAPPATPPPAAAPAAPMVNSIKILFDDEAKNNGELIFVFTPQAGAAKTISVTIAAKMNRKEVATAATTELTVALGAGFKVDKYDSDKIKITGKDKAKFSLTVSSMTANGLSIRLL